jgi:tetratricopeptide (TPR) repeat protein
VPHRLAAGDAARALHGLAEAAAQWQQGLADQPGPADEAALLARLCDAEWLRGRREEARSLHGRLQHLLANPAPGLSADATIGPDLRVDLQLRAARFLLDSGQALASMALLETLAPPAPAALRLRWRIERMAALHHAGRVDEAQAEGLQALEAAPTDTRDRAEVLASLAAIEHSCGQFRAAVGHADAGLAIYTRLGDAMGRARALFYRGAFSVELGDTEAGAADMHAAAALAARHGNLYLQRLALYNLASVYSNQTRPDEALAVAREAWPALAAEPRDELALMFRALFIECHHLRGEWGAMWEHLGPAVEQVLACAQPLAMVGVANSALEPAAALGQWDRVLPLVQALDARVFDEVASAAEVMVGCTYAALIMGDLSAAAGWLARVPAADRQEQPRVACRTQLLQAELRLAAGAGDELLAALPADDAPGMNAELRLRALSLRCRAGADEATRARALAALDDPGAHAGAALLLARSLGGSAYALRRQRLADSLAPWPEVQQSFLATWAV